MTGKQFFDWQTAGGVDDVMSLVDGLEKADIAAPFVEAVVATPQGARPSSCHPLYPLDGNAYIEYTEQVSDPNSYRQYIQRKLGAT